jgi:hypothetical protein
VPDEHHFLLQRVQPAMVGLIDGSLSTLAPIFGRDRQPQPLCLAAGPGDLDRGRDLDGLLEGPPTPES